MHHVIAIALMKQNRHCISYKALIFPFHLQVLRQTTLPIVPTRHQTFQRQLSHRLEMPGNIQFSICSLEQRSNSSIVGLIKVYYLLLVFFY